MGILKLIDNPCDTEEALYNLCQYITSPEKTRGFVGGRGLSPSTAYEEMFYAQMLWGKARHRRAYHLILSFEDTAAFIPDEAMEIAMQVSSLFFPPRQVLYGVHISQKHLHIHYPAFLLLLRDHCYPHRIHDIYSS